MSALHLTSNCISTVNILNNVKLKSCLDVRELPDSVLGKATVEEKSLPLARGV